MQKANSPISVRNGLRVATKSMIRYVTKKIRADPRSVEMTRIRTCAAARTVAITTLRKLCSVLRRPAIAKTKMILTNSDGCRENPAKEIESFAPLVTRAAIKTRPKSPIPTNTYPHVMRVRTSSLLTSSGTIRASTVPAAVISNCLIA